MPPFPLTLPVTTGPGRLVEIASYRKSNVSAAKYSGIFDSCMKTVATYPISRQGMFGSMLHDTEMQVMLLDWTSAAEKDEFEPGEQYQSLKPVFAELIDGEDARFACHHVILPGAATTAEAGGYLIAFATGPIAIHARIAEKLKNYWDEPHKNGSLLFAVAAPSRENAETVVSVMGWKGLVDAETGAKSPEFAILQGELVEMGAQCSQYVTELSRIPS